MDTRRQREPGGLAATIGASLVIALWMVSGECDRAWAEEAGGEKPRGPTEAVIRGWIGQLASPEYAVRERATSALIRAGGAARSQLREAAESADLETQLRARRILAIVEEVAREQQIAAFENDADGRENAILPGWERARPRLGEGAEYRKLFAEMYRCESSLFAAYERGNEAAAAAFEKRVRSFHEAKSRRSAVARTYRYRWSNGMLRPSLQALLLVGSDPDVAVSTGIVRQFDELLQQTVPVQSLKDFFADSALRESIGDWIEHRSTDAALQMQHLQLGMMYGVERALPLARQVLRDDASEVHHKREAVLCIAAFGGIEDTPLLEPLLEDDTRLRIGQRRVNNRKVSIESQLRDVALAALVRITRQDPRDYGIIGQPGDESSPMGPAAAVFFFLDDAARQKALAKWDAWRATHPMPAAQNRDKTPGAKPGE